MENSKRFCITPGSGTTYKPRIWVNGIHKNTEVGETLSRFSIWRGWDKEIKGYITSEKAVASYISYECRYEVIDQAKDYLISHGFELHQSENLLW